MKPTIIPSAASYVLSKARVHSSLVPDVPASFDKHSSGLFGEETPGRWHDRVAIEDRVHQLVRTQSARIGYTKTGRVAGIPVARFHKPLATVYNAKAVTWLRAEVARRRGHELGGWFDIHAAL